MYVADIFFKFRSNNTENTFKDITTEKQQHLSQFVLTPTGETKIENKWLWWDFHNPMCECDCSCLLMF